MSTPARFVPKNNDIMFGWCNAFRYVSAVSTRVLTVADTTGFEIGEVVYGDFSGATAIIQEVTSGTQLLVKESSGTWDATGVDPGVDKDNVKGIDSGTTSELSIDAAGTDLSKDHPPVSSDVDWVLNLESQAMLDLKPKPENVQKYYVGNRSRKYSYTYLTHWQPGSGSITGDLKSYHVLDAILGCSTQASDQTTYDLITMDGGGDGRKSFFSVYRHGTRYKSIIGMTANSLTLNMSEGSEVTFDMSVQTAREISVTDTFTPAANLIQTDISPFHWKHVGINLKLSSGADTDQTITGDEGNSTTSSVNYNAQSYDANFQVESCTLSITNNTTYKFGAPSTGGNRYASYYIEQLLEATVELVVYPTSELLWMLSPETLGNYGKKYVGWQKLPVTDQALVNLTIGEIIEGQSSGALAVLMSINNDTQDYLLVRQITGTFTQDEVLFGHSSLQTEDMPNVEIELHPESAQLDLTIKLDREIDSGSDHDYIQIDLTKLELDPVSEDLSNIEAGVDPITLTLRLAESASTISAIAHCPLHNNTSSNPY